MHYPNPSARAGCDTWLIFALSLTGLNSEFFLLLDWLPNHLPIEYLDPYINQRYVKGKQLHPGFELESPYTFPIIITVTLALTLYEHHPMVVQENKTILRDIE